jgi:hypothetical protein
MQLQMMAAAIVAALVMGSHNGEAAPIRQACRLGMANMMLRDCLGSMNSARFAEVFLRI